MGWPSQNNLNCVANGDDTIPLEYALRCQPFDHFHLLPDFWFINHNLHMACRTGDGFECLAKSSIIFFGAKHFVHATFSDRKGRRAQTINTIAETEDRHSADQPDTAAPAQWCFRTTIHMINDMVNGCLYLGCIIQTVCTDVQDDLHTYTHTHICQRDQSDLILLLDDFLTANSSSSS